MKIMTTTTDQAAGGASSAAAAAVVVVQFLQSYLRTHHLYMTQTLSVIVVTVLLVMA